MKIVDNVALIENRLLCAAIWGDESCVNKAPRFSGYVNASIDEVGKAFIEYCIAKIYGIFRLPQCGYDNYLSGRCNYNSLDANEVTDACNEMESVIKHVQRMLAQSERSVNGKIEADDNFVRLAFLRAAVFFFKTPFDQALSTILTAFVYNSCLSLLFDSTAASNAFIASLYAFLVALF